ncbi:MAG TPA: sugar ABC transporter permease [Candidatus Limnocylindrales bacterium]|nr:sugar ABC transporter permease [Candidatus Limnocylindrales bacterium]
MDQRLITAIVVVIAVPAVLLGYILLVERVLGLVPERRQASLRPWLWILPALLLLGFFLVYPTIATAIRSFQDKTAAANFIGFANYQFFFSSPDTLVALRNSFIWLVLLTALVVVGGLITAVLFDRVRYESVAKSLLFLPLAISFVGAGVIWKFMFDYEPAGQTQIGTINGGLTALGIGPASFITDAPANTIWLIVVGAWIWTGFAMVILSAALKGISPEILEAARVDGASELQLFRRITLPLLSPTIAVVATTMIITALKAFDIVYVMTSGNFDTNILALDMYHQLFDFGQPGRAAAVATILVILIIPVMIVNIRRFQAQEAIR